MERIKKCRICLEQAITLRSITETHLQEIYEFLTLMPLETIDRRPTLVCYICCARLHNCYQLRSSCIQSEKLFTQILESNVFPPVENESSCKNSFLIAHPVVHLSMGNELERSDSDDSGALEVFDEKTIKEEMGQEDEDSDSDENSIDPSMQYINTNDLLDIVKNELDDGITKFPVPEKPRLILQGNFEDITKMNQAANKIEQRKTVTKIAVRQENVTKTENIKQCNDKVDCNKNAFVENNKTSDLNDIRKETSAINASVDEVVSNSSHRNFKTYVCNICHKSFNYKKCLNKHFTQHIADKLFHCDVCQKSFRQKGSFNRHIRLHSGDKPYQCKHCKKCFSRNTDLVIHVRTHTGDKPFKCKLCTSCFSEKGTLNKHIRTHTKEKPFKCDMCKKCYNRKDYLSAHIRTHTGGKPFKCEICKRCFSRKEYLGTHICTHTDVKPFKCK